MVAAVSLGVARLEPAAAVVGRAAVWTDTVRRGPMLRQVRGTGTLVPERVQWVTAITGGRVEGILVEPGAIVAAETVLIELSDPQQQQDAAEAEYEVLRAGLESTQLEQEALAARVKAEYEQARLRAEADAELMKKGLVAELTSRISRSAAE